VHGRKRPPTTSERRKRPILESGPKIGSLRLAGRPSLQNQDFQPDGVSSTSVVVGPRPLVGSAVKSVSDRGRRRDESVVGGRRRSSAVVGRRRVTHFLDACHLFQRRRADVGRRRRAHSVWLELCFCNLSHLARRSSSILGSNSRIGRFTTPEVVFVSLPVSRQSFPVSDSGRRRTTSRRVNRSPTSADGVTTRHDDDRTRFSEFHQVHWSTGWRCM
jgi:hypothetical protein